VIVGYIFPISICAQFTEINQTIAYSGRLNWIDYDCDGNLDLQVGGELYRNDLGFFTDSGLSVAFDKGQWLDYDLDGDMDFLNADSNPAIIYLNHGTYFEQVSVYFPLGEFQTYVHGVWGDFDNDSDIDFACLAKEYDNLWPISSITANFLLYKNDQGIFTHDSSNDGLELRDADGIISCVDVDSDGILDFFVTGCSELYNQIMAQFWGRVYESMLISRSNNSDEYSGYFHDESTSGEVTTWSTGLSNAQLDWGDYNNSGRLDLLISGYHEDYYIGLDADDPYELLNSYDFNGVFDDLNVPTPSAVFSDYQDPEMRWGDMDNDGDLDIIISNHIHYNNNGTFTNNFVSLGSLAAGSVALGDFDNDGDLDVALSTDSGTRIFRNDTTSSNQPPNPPQITITSSNDFVRVSITNSNDDNTATPGLSYNIRVGSSSGGHDIVCPPSNVFNGQCYTAARGFNPRISIAPNDTIYVSAQAVDNCFKGSLFSTEIQYTSPPIHILYPNGGQTLVSGSTSYIQWLDNDVYSLNIQFSTNGGTNWVNLSTNPVLSAPGLYYYTVPSANSSQCLMRIAWVNDETYYDVSDQPFTITASTSVPKITVSTPSATGVYLTPGMPYNITWSSQNLSSLSIDYTVNNGLTWNTLIENIPATPASYSWSVPDSVSNQCRIRIRKANDPGCYDISDNAFTICKVTVLSPNGGEVLTGDYSGINKHLITWDAPYVTNLILYYSINNGSTWTTIATVAANLGQYLWTIPALESANCRIKASHANASYISDMSNAVFTLRVPAKLFNCNGGGYVNNNTSYRVRWQRIDISPDKLVFIESSPNNSTWTRINANAIPITLNEHTFFLALGTSSQIWFRMLESDTSRIVAKSSAAMTVTEKQLRLIAPSAGIALGIESYFTISWTSDGCTNLNISYTANFGTTWIPIASNIPASQMNYVWQIPNTPSSQCRIRLQDTTYSYMNIESDNEFTIQPNNFIASFYATPTTGHSDLEVSFIDQSIGYISSWAWDFQNDGIIDSNLQNPVWTYRESGFYSVKLTISDGAWDMSVTRNNYIYVLPMEAQFTLTETSGYVPHTVQFIDQTMSDVDHWLWDFDSDGVIDALDQNPFWTYLFPGIYTVTLTVSNGLESSTVVSPILVTTSLDPAHTLYAPTQYLTIQAAINASVDGDYIIVADGTYYENLLIEGKNITLASWYFIDGDSTHIANTIIDGSNALNPDQASTITILPSGGRPVSQPHITGFTIRSGSGRRIIQNEGGSTIEKRVGGGIYIRQANPMFSYNRIEDNDADDEGGGSYAFQSLPNFGGMVNAAVGIRNPGANYFRNNHADIGSDIYIHGVTTRDDIKLQNCNFEVFSTADTTLSNYWATSSAPLSFTGCGGLAEAISSDIYVTTNGNDTLNDGLSPSSPFKTIDHALSMIYATEANPLTIHIASGTYSPSLTGEKFPLQMVKHVSLQGSGTDETFLDAEASADFPRRVLNLDKVEGVQLSDLTLMNGFVTLAKNYNGGAIAILDSQASLQRLIIAGSSSAGNGAGIYALDSTLEADSVDIQYNSALGSGGAIHSVQSALSLSSSQISNNSVSKNGAGISIDGGQILITDCQISQNQATGYQSKGGGLSISGTEDALISGNRISNNNADNGAGAYLQDNTALRLDRNHFSNNLADYSGGALFINTSDGNIGNNLISHNTATQRGGALYCYSPVHLIQNSIVKNKAGLQGGGLYLNSASPSLSGNVIWGNVQAASDAPNQFYLYGEASDPELRYCLVEAGSAGFDLSPGTVYSGLYEANLDTDPLFTGPIPSAGYHNSAVDDAYSLTEASPCVDAGDPLADLLLWSLDLIGNPRVDNGRVDIGAWEKPHFTGPRLLVQPASLDFGRVNINGQSVSMELTLQNTGNQPLQITSLSFQTTSDVFTLDSRTRDQIIAPGSSQSIQISFLPLGIGPHSNALLIHSNSLFTPILSVPLSGYGVDVSGSVPSNLQLQIVGDDVHLAWDPVESDPSGNPFTPAGYIVLYSENANEVIDNYFFLNFTADAHYTHTWVARYRGKMFYRVIAVDGHTRAQIEALLAGTSRSEALRWQEIRRRLRF